MAVQAYPYLALTDGTTTVTFQDGSGGITNYPLLRDTWAPAIAQLSASQIGSSPYDYVVEEFQITIRDTTAALAMNRLLTLETLLDQAERWRRGENQSPVTLNYAPQGSTLASTGTPYQVIVLGRVGESNLVNLPKTWSRTGLVYEMHPVTVRLLRRPQWLLSTTAASSSGAANPNIMTTTLASLGGFSPAKITVAGLGSITSTGAGGGWYLLCSSITNGIQLFNMSLTGGAPFSTVSDSTNAALSGSVVRYTPAGTSTVAFPTPAAIASPGGSGDIGLVTGYLACRNNGSSTYRLQMGWYNSLTFSVAPAYATNVSFARPVTVDASTSSPRIVPLGTMAVRGQNAFWNIYVTASAASGSLDFDYLVLVLGSTYSAGVVRAVGNLGDLGIVGTCYMIYDPQPLTNLSPITTFADATSSPTHQDYPAVDAYVAPHVTGTTILTTLLGTAGAKWCLSTGTSGASLTTTVSRYNAYLTPA